MEGLGAGDDGYLVHPAEPEELLATISALLRMKSAEERAERRNLELEAALARIKALSGMLSLCASFKKIRDEQGYWKALETTGALH